MDNIDRRRDPFHEMMSLRNAMDRLFENAFVGPAIGWERPFGGDPALDVIENEDEFVVKASIPGMDPDDLEITFSDRLLTIKGEVKEEEERQGEQYHIRERRFGAFSRSVSLPTAINADAIEANYESGVLQLRLPKAEEVKPKRISIKASKMIEGDGGQRR